MNKGFTLIETLTYIALSVVLLAAIINATVLLSTSYRHIAKTQDIESSGLFVMNQIIHQAHSVSGATIGDSSLTLGNTRFYLSDGKVLEDKDGQYFGLLSGDASVDSLVFKGINTGNSTGVKIELSIEGKHFYDTVLF